MDFAFLPIGQADAMTIDWFTFTAQLINFLILVWLLKRFLYGPIVRAIEDREAKMAQRVEEVDAAQQAAEREEARYRQKVQELEHTREELVAETTREIEEWKREHLEAARRDVEQTRSEWQRGLEREQEAFVRELRQRAGGQAQEVARTVLQKLADVSLESRIIDSFLDQLRNLGEQQRQELAAAIHNGEAEIVVKSAFEMSEEGRSKIQQVMDELFATRSPQFRTDDALICGIELQAGGYKVAWSIGETLEELEEEFATALEGARPE